MSEMKRPKPIGIRLDTFKQPKKLTSENFKTILEAAIPFKKIVKREFVYYKLFFITVAKVQKF